MNQPHDPHVTTDSPSAPSDSLRAADPLLTTDPARGMADTQVTQDAAPVGSQRSASEFPAVPGYRVLREIARGGMGKVLAAFDLTLDRDVALKILLPGANADRFVRESKITARLPHPGIPPVHALGTLADGSPFLAMKLIVGQTLADELKTADRPRLLQVFTQVCQAVGFAHSRGIIHRDLKPANIMVGAFGEVQVMDWGLAKDLANREVADEPRWSVSGTVPSVGLDASQTTDHRPPGESTDDRTQFGTVMGTPAYMAPEQARGEVSDARADVFALGGILCTILTGQPPIVGMSSLDVIRRAGAADLSEANQRLDACGADAELVALCRRCLSPNPVDRPADGQAVADGLTAYLNGVQEQLQAFERERAVELAKATEQRKRRRAVGLLSVAVVIILVVGSLVAWERQNAVHARGLVNSLTNAAPPQVTQIVAELTRYQRWANPALDALARTKPTSESERRSQLHACLASVARDPSLVEPLVEELLTGKVTYVSPIRQQLSPYSSQLTDQFRSLLRDEKAEPKRRFHAALALADYIPESESASWTDQDLKFVTQQLVSENAEFQPLLREALRPIRGKLLTDLERIFRYAKATDAQRLSAANAFADYSASDVARLSQLLVVATEEQYAVLYPLVAASPAPDTIDNLSRIATTLPPDELGTVDRVAFGQRRANAAVTLLRLGQREKVLPVFELTDDPEALTQFIFRCLPRGVGVEPLLDCLRLVSDAPKDRYPRHTRYALLLALGEFSLEEIPRARREALLKQLAEWHGQDPSSGVHGAAGWLLRKWGQTELAREVDQTPVPYSPDREWFTLAITVTPTPPPQPKEKPAPASSGTDPAEQAKPEPSAKPLPPQTFYYTFLVFPAGDYELGSVPDEPDRLKNEFWPPVKLTRPFALLDREITWEELIAFNPMFAGYMQQSDAPPTGAGAGADWYDAVGFCRWLGQQSGLSEEEQPYAAPEAFDKAQYPREPNPRSNWAPRNWPLELGKRGFRLPTDAEWEVASRAGTRTMHGFGSEAGLLGHFGWSAENSEKRAHPPRQLRPSLHGLFDLYGNMAEWTHDWYGEYGVEAITDPLGVKEGASRVIRGGNWGNDATLCRSAFRGTNAPTIRSPFYGIRLALSPSGVSSPAKQGQGKEVEPAGEGTEGAKAEPRPELP